jgi:hypothetical protein
MTDELDRHLASLAALGELELGHGPSHPLNPQPELGGEIARFLARYPFLRRDGDYVTFLERYAGALVTSPHDMFSLGIYGFDENVTMHIVSGPGDVVANGFLTIADVLVPNEPEKAFSENNEGVGFGFDATGSRRWGIHRLRDGGVTAWYAESFVDWLRLLVEKHGRVNDALTP